MRQKRSGKSAKRSIMRSGKSLRLLKRAQRLIALGRFAEARRLLRILIATSGPHVKRVRQLMARLPRVPAIKPGKKRGGRGGRKESRGRLRFKITRRISKGKKRGARRRGGLRGRASGLILKVDALRRSVSELNVFARIDPRRTRQPRTGRRPSKIVRASTRARKPQHEPRVIRRTPHIDLLPAAGLRPGDLFDAQVYVDKKKLRTGETGSDVKIPAKKRTAICPIDVWMAASRHFIVKLPNRALLQLDTKASTSACVTFQLQVESVNEPSGAVVIAYFSHEGRPCGQVLRNVELAAVSQAAPPNSPASRVRVTSPAPPRAPSSSFQVTPGLPPADITVEVTDPERTRRNLVCKVSSRLLSSDEQPAPAPWHLSDKSDVLVKAYMKEFVNDKNHRAYSLTGAGQKLYAIAPAAFQDVFWKVYGSTGRPLSILIASDEPNIPWELMVPSRRLESGQLKVLRPLGVECNVGRWIRDDHLAPPASVPMKKCFVIAPLYESDPAPLAKANEEVELVLHAVPGSRIDPADLATIKRKLGGGGVSLLHFICHGVDDGDSDVQAIFLEGGEERLTSLEVTAIPPVISAFKRRPMVFLNACEVGRPAVALTGIGGFAAAFLEMGAAAVVAPLWSVKDTVAYKVARLFYKDIMSAARGQKRRAFADVMRTIRERAYDEKTGEDTYAAYAYYGDPHATAS